jgi:hypothetical protein
METEKIFNDINNLPPQAQRQVADFIAFLRTRYKRPDSQPPRQSSLANEPFIGMWKDRQDTQDSRTWLRGVRKSEWRDPRA